MDMHEPTTQAHRAPGMPMDPRDAHLESCNHICGALTMCSHKPLIPPWKGNSFPPGNSYHHSPRQRSP
eukprot:3857267-Alexandrium_andersonii.AAC.1